MLSFDKLDLFDDESEDDGYGSGSPGTCVFPFCSGKYVGIAGKSVGRVCGVGSGVFVSTEIESIGDFFVGRVRNKSSRVQMWLTHRNILPLKIFIFPPSVKISFVTIVLL